MKHTKNTVKRGGRRARLADPVEEFKLFSGGTLGGLRTAAGRLLRQTHDIDLSPDIKDAVLYGSTLKPVKTGDFAQLETIGVERRLKRQQPHIFIGELTFSFLGPGTAVFYTPDRPEQLHRVYISSTVNTVVTFSRILTPAPAPPISLFWGNSLPNLSLAALIEFGEIGVLLTPANPFLVSARVPVDIIISLQLSTAQLA